MNNIDTSQLLTQLRAAAAQARTDKPAEPEQVTGDNFSSLLTQSLDKVNEMQEHSGKMKTAFELGDPNVSLPQVMIASSKANLAFQATLQVRNKVVEAYQEIMRMPV
jgi:flagellar hook-basal body complex protein FliE